MPQMLQELYYGSLFEYLCTQATYLILYQLEIERSLRFTCRRHQLLLFLCKYVSSVTCEEGLRSESLRTLSAPATHRLGQQDRQYA